MFNYSRRIIMKKKFSKKGFTLVELVVVIAILAILAAILVPSILDYVEEATQAKDAANARTIYTEYTMHEATRKADDPDFTFPTGGKITGTKFSCTFGKFVYAAPDFTPDPVTPDPVIPD